MKLAFLGAAGTVTGSRTLVEHAGARYLVDCGLFQGLKALRQRNWEPFPVAPDSIEAVILTHAHVDHSGYLPVLVRNGFRGKVYCSPATKALCEILLPDAAWLQEEQARFANRHGFSRHKPALPLFTREDAAQALKQFHPVAWHRPTPLGSLSLELHRAGHILGASIVVLAGAGRRLAFSGDLGRPNDPVMRAPEPIEAADHLVVESTYGNRRHPVSNPEQELAAHLRRGLERGGAVIIPAFAVGRAQSLLHHLARLKGGREIPDVPVFLNSPMAINATSLYREYQDEHRLSRAEYEAAFGVAKMVHTPEESRALNGREGPMIIVSAAGMATGGRVVHHIRAFAPDPRNMILFPGFQAAGTRGAAMTGGAEAVKIHGEYVPVRAEVVRMDSLSAHADYAEIIGWLAAFARPPRAVFVNHGEPAAADEMRRRVRDALGWSCVVPGLGDSVVLDG